MGFDGGFKDEIQIRDFQSPMSIKGSKKIVNLALGGGHVCFCLTYKLPL